ncbi:MAG: HU family DNA-binding protein, partial [Bdellovibrionota bacterium]
MNKAQLIEKIATESKMSKTQCETIVDCFMTNVKKTVKKGDDVKLVGFGTFTKAKR